MKALCPWITATLAWIFLGISPDPHRPTIETQALVGAKADVMALLLQGRDSGALPAAASATPLPEQSRVEFWLDVEALGLLGDERGATHSDGPETLRLDLHVFVLSQVGEIVGSASHRALLPVQANRTQLETQGLRFAGHFDLEPGEYEIRALLLEPKAQRFAFRVMPVVLPEADTVLPGADAVTVTSGDAPTAWLAWTPIRAPSEEEQRQAAERATEDAEAAETQATELESQRASERVDTLARAYGGVLERLATGDWETARDGLARLEAAALASPDQRAQARNWLVSAQDRVIRPLAEREPEALLPLLMLHMERHDQDLAAGVQDPYRLNTTRERILDLARAYTRGAKSELAPSLVATALAELGVALDRAGLALNARRMLVEALEVDETHVAVLLYLAYWHERRNDPEDAVALLRRLLAAAPRSQEGRLRLALNLRHLGQTEEAESLLRQMIRDAPSDWLLTLAYQELGRHLLAQDQIDEAIQVLRQAVARLPNQQRLHIHLAYLLDRGGQKRRGREVIQRLPPEAGRDTPRLVYSQRPSAGSEPARDALRRHSLARLPLLAAALSAL